MQVCKEKIRWICFPWKPTAGFICSSFWISCWYKGETRGQEKRSPKPNKLWVPLYVFPSRVLLLYITSFSLVFWVGSLRISFFFFFPFAIHCVAQTITSAFPCRFVGYSCKMRFLVFQVSREMNNLSLHGRNQTKTMELMLW